jgi:segregation and condensation protein B
MEKEQLKHILEGALLAANEPLPLSRLAALFDLEDSVDNSMLRDALAEIKEACSDHSYELVEVGSGWRFQVRQQYSQWVNKLWEEKPPRYSRATMETLALIAYRQPITRGDIEEVRGVSVSSNIIHSLMERNWIRIVGHRDVPGRPALYATTKQFLDYFNIKSLDQLPSLSEIRDIKDLNEELPFDERSLSSEVSGEEKSSVSDQTIDEALPDQEDEAASSMATLILPGG